MTFDYKQHVTLRTPPHIKTLIFDGNGYIKPYVISSLIVGRDLFS